MAENEMDSPGAATNQEEIGRLVRDFEERTLPGLEGYFCQLVYLASLRDYNTGRYHHYGLESRYSPEAIDAGLAPVPRADF